MGTASWDWDDIKKQQLERRVHDPSLPEFAEWVLCKGQWIWTIPSELKIDDVKDVRLECVDNADCEYPLSCAECRAQKAIEAMYIRNGWTREAR